MQGKSDKERVLEENAENGVKQGGTLPWKTSSGNASHLEKQWALLQ